LVACSLFSVRGRLGQRQQELGSSGNQRSASSRMLAAALQQPTVGKFDARQKLSSPNSGKFVDARQRLLQKTKFADARQRIEKKKLQVHSEAASDMRMKILAKRRLGPSWSPVRPPAAGQQVATKSSAMVVTVSDRGRVAATARGNAVSAETRVGAVNTFGSSCLVSL